MIGLTDKLRYLTCAWSSRTPVFFWPRHRKMSFYLSIIPLIGQGGSWLLLRYSVLLWPHQIGFYTYSSFVQTLFPVNIFELFRQGQSVISVILGLCFPFHKHRKSEKLYLSLSACLVSLSNKPTNSLSLSLCRSKSFSHPFSKTFHVHTFLSQKL